MIYNNNTLSGLSMSLYLLSTCNHYAVCTNLRPRRAPLTFSALARRATDHSRLIIIKLAINTAEQEPAPRRVDY